jgi:hypothetical protein
MPGYSPIYSYPFVYYTGDPDDLQFLVPSGYTAVVRDMTAFASLGAGEAQLQIGPDPVDAMVTVAAITLGGADTYGQWTGRVVAPSEWVINAVANGPTSGLSIYVGGYLLRNTAQ